MADFKHPGEHAYEGVTYTESIPKESLEKVKDMELRPDDVILATYPKSGTMWLRGIISMVMQDGAPVPENAREKGNTFPLIEVHRKGRPASVDIVANNPSPRLLATHLRSSFLEEQIRSKHPRVIMLMRNPKDALTSYFHFYRANGSLGQFKGTFEEWWKLVEEDRVCYGDIVDYCKDWWSMRDEEGVLMLQFEELKRDHEGCVRKIAKHVGKDLSDDIIKTIVHETTFDVMKKNPAFSNSKAPKEVFDASITPSMRKGAVADWKNHFTQAHHDFLDKQIKEKLADTGLTFTFELKA